MKRQQKHRDKRISEGYRPVYFLLSGEAIAELDHRRKEAGLTRTGFMEQWLKNNSTDHDKSC